MDIKSYKISLLPLCGHYMKERRKFIINGTMFPIGYFAIIINTVLCTSVFLAVT